MQAEEKAEDTDISKTQVNELSLHDKIHNYGREETPGNSMDLTKKAGIILPELWCISTIPKIKRCMLRKNRLPMSSTEK